MGVVAILIDRLFLEPKKAKFRLHAMPLAVGMYLPWTVTFPILFGGLAYVAVIRRSRKRGDDEQAATDRHSSWPACFPRGWSLAKRSWVS